MASFPTPTIVRIKRRLGTESSETIIVSAKRMRSDCDEKDDMKDPIPEVCTAIFKKLTTLKQGDAVEVEAKKALENEPKHSWEIKENFKKGFHSSAKDLIQKKSKSDIAAIRFKLVCAKRNLKQSELEDASFHMFDALKEEENALLPVASSSSNTGKDIISCNGIPMESENVEFVYDLYYTSLPLELTNWVNNICEIEKCHALDYRDENSKITEIYEDDSDENSESNWRNDYPDEDEAQYYDNEDDFLCEELKKKVNLDENTDESFDVDEYDADGDFDEEGSLLIIGVPKSVFGLQRKRGKVGINSDESESDSD